MNVRKAVMPVVCLLVAVGSALAQHRVDPSRMYARIYVIVPMVGSGTWEDPKRPMFAPVPNQTAAGSRTGIIAFNSVASDDGNFALVEFVAENRLELAKITAPVSAGLASVPGPQMFDRSTVPDATVQSAFQLLKKNFDISKFRTVVP